MDLPQLEIKQNDTSETSRSQENFTDSASTVTQAISTNKAVQENQIMHACGIREDSNLVQLKIEDSLDVTCISDGNEGNTIESVQATNNNQPKSSETIPETLIDMPTKAPETKLSLNIIKALQNVGGESTGESGKSKDSVTCKRRIIVAKVSSDILKQMVTTKGVGAHSVESERGSLLVPSASLSNAITDALKKIEETKSTNPGSSQIFVTKIRTKDSVSDLLQSESKNNTSKVGTKINKSYQSSKAQDKEESIYRSLLKTDHRATKQENKCPCPDLCHSKYFSTGTAINEEDCESNLVDYMFSTARTCLLVTLPLSPGYENEKVNADDIMVENSIVSHSVFEKCPLEIEINKIFHYFCCKSLTEDSSTSDIKACLFKALNIFEKSFSIVEALKLVCNCSLCWYIYARGKIINTYYPENDLSFKRCPLATFRCLAIKKLIISEVISDSSVLSKDFKPEEHFILPLRFRRCGKKRDHAKKSLLCDSFRTDVAELLRTKKISHTALHPITPRHENDENVSDYVSNQPKNSENESNNETKSTCGTAVGKAALLSSKQLQDTEKDVKSKTTEETVTTLPNMALKSKSANSAVKRKIESPVTLTSKVLKVAETMKSGCQAQMTSGGLVASTFATLQTDTNPNDSSAQSVKSVPQSQVKISNTSSPGTLKSVVQPQEATLRSQGVTGNVQGGTLLQLPDGSIVRTSGPVNILRVSNASLPGTLQTIGVKGRPAGIVQLPNASLPGALQAVNVKSGTPGVVQILPVQTSEGVQTYTVISNDVPPLRYVSAPNTTQSKNVQTFKQ